MAQQPPASGHARIARRPGGCGARWQLQHSQARHPTPSPAPNLVPVEPLPSAACGPWEAEATHLITLVIGRHCSAKASS